MGTVNCGFFMRCVTQWFVFILWNTANLKAVEHGQSFKFWNSAQFEGCGTWSIFYVVELSSIWRLNVTVWVGHQSFLMFQAGQGSSDVSDGTVSIQTFKEGHGHFVICGVTRSFCYLRWNTVISSFAVSHFKCFWWKSVHSTVLAF